MTPHAALPRRPSASRKVCACLAVALVVAGLCCAEPASSATQTGLIVVPHPSPQIGLSYFKLTIRAGRLVHAGTVELRNPSRHRRLVVALTGVDAQTLGTLGSGYAPPGSRAQGPTRWLHLGRPVVSLAPRQSAVVPVAVGVPHHAAPGDYLSGVSIEALGQDAQSARGGGVAIANVDRYVIGVDVQVPGPQHPLIRFTGASLERQPAGLSFLLAAQNRGNVILQNVRGRVLITNGPRTVAEVQLGPGTFVSGTSVAYPIPTPRQHPEEGTVYRVQAYLRYRGGTAHLDSFVRFGHAAAVTQQNYGGPKVRSINSSGISTSMLGLIGGLFALCLALFAALLVRRRRHGRRPPLRMLDAALAASRERGEPLSLITVAPPAGARSVRKLLALVRSRLRKSDRICRLQGGGLFVLAADTDRETAEALAADLRRQLERVDAGARDVTIEVHCPEDEATAADLLQRMSQADARELVASG
jgi:hypothetical protein